MHDDTLSDHLVERSGIPDRVALRRALTVTLRAIRDHVGKTYALHLAAQLPESMAVGLRGATRRPTDLAGTIERVHVETGLRRDAALEATQCCLGELGSLLAEEDRRELMAKLPAEYATSIERVELRRPSAGDGRVSSAHGQSIAASDDPHHDTRLSSAEHVRGRKLSEAAPATGRGLADAGPDERSLAAGTPGAGERSLADVGLPPRDDRARRRK